MNIGNVNGGQADMVQTLMAGPMQEVDMAMKITRAEMQMQLEGQKMAQTQAVVAQMTGVGGELDIHV